ncbi:hypothetical protein KZX46_08655 [Polymorphobacter sp. PAMC 29334]|nr:hypothetical protein KZX46_08655 [Polymorphobacter sp. PAMC 29334]
MMRATIALMIILASAAATPVAAQSMLKAAPTDTSLPRQKVVEVFGTDPCPKSTDPDEIIVCSRRPDEDRYRIPPAVRSDAQALAPNVANRKLLLGDDAGGAGGGIGSCSAVGPGGGTGCNQAIQDQYRAARKRGDVPQSILPQITPDATITPPY